MTDEPTETEFQPSDEDLLASLPEHQQELASGMSAALDIGTNVLTTMLASHDADLEAAAVAMDNLSTAADVSAELIEKLTATVEALETRVTALESGHDDDE